MLLRFLFLLLGLIAIENCRLDPIADLEKTIVSVDSAIASADEAWLNAFAQTKVLEVISSSFDQTSKIVKDAQATKDSCQSQIDSYAKALDDLYAKRFELVSTLSYLKNILSVPVVLGEDSSNSSVLTENAETVAQINRYKQQYITRIGEMNAALATIERTITGIQGIFDRGGLTADGLLSLVAMVGDAKNAQNLLKNSLDAVIVLNTQIRGDFQQLLTQAKTSADNFSMWLREQQVVVATAKKSFEDRQVYFAQLDKQLDEKKVELSGIVTKAIDVQKELDNSSMEKNDLFNLFKTKYSEASDLTQKISKTVFSIVSWIEFIDRDIDSVVSLDNLEKIKAQVDEKGTLLAQVGIDKNLLSATRDEEVKIWDQMQKIFTSDEMSGYKESFTRQQEWIATTVDKFNVLIDQISMVQTKITEKKSKLVVKSESLSSDVMMNYAESLDKFKKILTNVKADAFSVVRDLNPLVMGISQKFIGLADFFDLDVQTEASLADLRKSLDDISADYSSINEKLEEYSIYAQTFADSNSMIGSATQDAQIKDLLNEFRLNFDEWNIWVGAASNRQADLIKRIATAEKKFIKLSDSFKALKSSVLETKSPDIQSVQSALPVLNNVVKSTNTPPTEVVTQKTADETKRAENTKQEIASAKSEAEVSATKEFAVASVNSEAESKTLKLVANITTAMNSFVLFRKNIDDSKDIFEKIKSDADYQSASARTADVKKQLVQYQGIFDKLSIESDSIQKLIDQDRAAGKNLSNSIVENLDGSKAIISQAKKDLDASRVVLSDALQLFDKISVDYSRKANGLTVITAQISLVSEKIQFIKNILSQIESIVKNADNLSSGTTAIGLIQSSLNDLATVENLKTTIVNDKINILVPELNKLKKDLVPKYIQAYGQLPDSSTETIDKQSLWIDGLDSLLNSVVGRVESLNKKLQGALTPLLEDDIKAFSLLTFAQQMRSLEGDIQSGDLEIFMKRLSSSFKNRYGNRPEDKDVNVIATNKARLKRLVDFILPRARFKAKKEIIKDYSDQII
jgi:hypothetical protein